MSRERPIEPKPVPIIRGVSKGFRRCWREKSLLHAVRKPFRVRATAVPGSEQLQGSYFVSSEKGVFLIGAGACLRLAAQDAYGMAYRDNALFVAFSCDTMSSIVRLPLDREPVEGGILQPEEIFRTAINKSGRIHQIGFFGKFLAVAMTADNRITLLDPATGESRHVVEPFRDAFDRPIGTDHNHINSVSQAGDCLLFVAYRAGNRSLLGIVHGDEIIGYGYENTGVHDVYLTGKDLYFCDTFGTPVAKGGDGCGFLLCNNSRVDAEFFGRAPGYATRGLAGNNGELVVGHSHKGARRVRFEGKGALIRFVKDKVVDTIELPFAQVYDVMSRDGTHCSDAPGLTGFGEIRDRFEEIFGPPIFRQKVETPMPSPY